ncbi:MAG TPA: DoxX family protein [Chloroflexia bacterium]|nr:DoxX family protein [Chloroflexia bacterium]
MLVNGQISQVAFLIGRLMVGGMYVGAGINNLTHLGATAGYAASKGVPSPAFLVVVASVLLLIGGASLLTGFQPRAGVAAVLGFLVPVTLVMHNFWALQGMQADLEMHSFLANLALAGSALMFLLIPQPWATSVDRWLSARRGAAPGGHVLRTAQQAATAPAER